MKKPTTDKDFNPIKNPYIVGNAIKSKEMFFGREDDFKNIENWITTDGPKVILLIGGRRSGKSSILLQILEGRLHQAGEAVLCDFQKMVPRIKQDEDFPYEVGKAILENPKFKPFEADFLKDDNTSWTVRLDLLVQNCLNLIKPRKLMILCDEFESIERLFKSCLSANALSWIKEIHNLPVHFVMTGSREFENNTVRAVLTHIAQMYPLHELSQQDTLALIQNPIGDNLSYKDEVPEIIYRLSGGQPFYTQYICHTLVNHVNSELKRNYVVAEDFDGVIDFIVRHPTGHIQETWKSFSNQDSAPKYRRETLAALAHTIRHSKEYVSSSKIFKTVRKQRFNVDKPGLYKTLAGFIQNTRLLETKNDNYRFRIDILRHWITYTFPTGEYIEPFKLPKNRREAYAKKVEMLLNNGVITLTTRIELDNALTEWQLEREQAEDIENQFRKIDWVNEYKDSCLELSKQYSDGVPKPELKRLQSTYVFKGRVSKHKAKEIHKYHILKPSFVTTLKRQMNVFLDFKENKYLWAAVGMMAVITLAVLIILQGQAWQHHDPLEQHHDPLEQPTTTLSEQPGSLIPVGEFDFIVCARSASDSQIWKRLFLAKSSGENELLLKAHEDYQLYPSISKDKNLLVFQQGLGKSAKICLVNLETRAIINDCKHPGKMPSISPDGQKIVYIPVDLFSKSKSQSLEIMNLNDFKPKKIPISLSHNEIARFQRPAFLNDSESIVFLGREVTSNHMEVVLYEPDRPSNKQFQLLTNYAQHMEFITPATNSISLLFAFSHAPNESTLLIQPDFRKGDIVEIPCEFRAKFPVFSRDEKQIYFISDNRVKYIESRDQTCDAKDYTGKLDMINMIDLILIQ
jgi:archaellum biogenesis ATPase FlaH